MITSAHSPLSRVLWLGGASGVGKTTVARQIARKYDLRLYSLDSRTWAHEEQLEPDTHTLDERWVDSSPAELAAWFEQHARNRFPLVLADLNALPADAPVIADGPQLLPELVRPFLDDTRRALFIVADSALQHEIVTARGSLTYGQTRDPERALANRLARDTILAANIRATATAAGLAVASVEAIDETGAAIERHFKPFIDDWLALGDRGDVSARRRDENDNRLQQWRAYSDRVPAAAAQVVHLACECDLPGCKASVPTGLDEAETMRASGQRILADHDWPG